MEIIRSLTHSMLAHGLNEASLLTACAETFGRRYIFAKRLVKRVLTRFRAGSRPSRRKIETFLEADPPLLRAISRLDLSSHYHEPIVTCRMHPAAGPPQGWNLPPLLHAEDLANWLGEDWSHLQWLADRKGLLRKNTEFKLRHYLYRWISKRDGSARMIESPKVRLKTIQRRILHEILHRMPPHESAHGFRPGRSVLTYAGPHTGREMVLRMDLDNFFPRIQRSRISALFLTAGYPDPVAEILADLCCNTTPRDVFRSMPATVPAEQRWHYAKMYEISHLPQGAPTSPALANLSAFKLDCRLAGLARAAGATFTRYADDLTFSGDRAFARAVARFSTQVAAIALEEGFQVNHRKTRVMRKSISQRCAGITLNEGLNISRKEFDLLKAILHNARKHGLESQNRDSLPNFRAHLAGRIAWVRQVAPARGAKLQALWDEVV